MSPRPNQLRPPRLADTVADSLRERILAREFEATGMLPKQEELVDQFRVSLPCVREALRTLEVEGLISVRRGNVGGSAVHLPQPDKVGYMLGLVLQSRDTGIDDLVAAISQLQPIFTRACALRADRARTVVPRLQRLLDASEQLIDDPIEFAAVARSFHEELVARCGNETLIVLVGALERLWSGQVRDMRAVKDLGEFAQLATRQACAQEHRAIVACIEAGDADGAAEAARLHQAEPARHGLVGRRRRVSASPLREP